MTPSLYSSANQKPASCHPMSLFSRLNILPPFVANVKSIYQSVHHKHDVWCGPLFEVWAFCVLKSIFQPPFGFTRLNHLVHNRNIKMSKWPNYFCGINNALTIVAKLLQHLKASWLGRNFSPLSCNLQFHLLTF